MKIGSRSIGPGHKCYVIAELSANHGNDFGVVESTVRAMKDAGADAVKVQTYTADTITLDCDLPPFVVGGGTLWDGKTLHELYEDAAMPWEWQPKIKELAEDLAMDFFSSPFDASAVDFLEQLSVPVHKVASFELVDVPLLQKIAATGKPVIMSTGMGTKDEIDEALTTLKQAGSGPIALLKCTSAYPADPGEMNLRSIPDMQERFSVPVGLSDHTMGHTVPVAAVALGACIVEKHFIIDRHQGGPDSSFSMEPDEFKSMVEAIRVTEQALGVAKYGVSEKEAKSRAFRRSLFVSADLKSGQEFTTENVRSVRPANGLHTRHLHEILGRRASTDLSKGTALSWDHIEN
jgi:pseudaminic acid synthase